MHIRQSHKEMLDNSFKVCAMLLGLGSKSWWPWSDWNV